MKENEKDINEKKDIDKIKESVMIEINDKNEKNNNSNNLKKSIFPRNKNFDYDNDEISESENGENEAVGIKFSQIISKKKRMIIIIQQTLQDREIIMMAMILTSVLE